MVVGGGMGGDGVGWTRDGGMVGGDGARNNIVWIRRSKNIAWIRCTFALVPVQASWTCSKGQLRSTKIKTPEVT